MLAKPASRKTGKGAHKPTAQEARHMVRLVLEHANGKWLWGPQWKFTLLEQGVGVGVGWNCSFEM